MPRKSFRIGFDVTQLCCAVVHLAGFVSLSVSTGSTCASPEETPSEYSRARGLPLRCIRRFLPGLQIGINIGRLAYMTSGDVANVVVDHEFGSSLEVKQDNDEGEG